MVNYSFIYSLIHLFSTYPVLGAGVVVVNKTDTNLAPVLGLVFHPWILGSAFVPSPHLFSLFRGYCRCNWGGKQRQGGITWKKGEAKGQDGAADLSLVSVGH